DPCAALRELQRLGAQHHVGEVDVPRMRRHVRALGHVAQVAQVALVDHVPELRLLDAVDLHRRAPVDEIEERRERRAQVHAAAAAVADLEDALHLREHLRLVQEIGRAPRDRVARGRFEAAFALGHGDGTLPKEKRAEGAAFRLSPRSAQSDSASSAFWKRLACERSAFASVSNQSAISPKPSWRACFAMPGYMSVYSCVSPAIAALRFNRVPPIGRPVAGSPDCSRYSRCPCACPVSPSAVERNTAATSFWPSTSAFAAKYR